MYYKTISPIGHNIIIYKDNDMLYSFTEDNENTDYKKYLNWVAEGNEPEPWQP